MLDLFARWRRRQHVSCSWGELDEVWYGMVVGKKKRLTQQLEKLRKTATSLQESSDLGDSGKARAMRKAVGKVLRGGCLDCM